MADRKVIQISVGLEPRQGPDVSPILGFGSLSAECRMSAAIRTVDGIIIGTLCIERR
jgi:hypothetical protein